MVKKDWKNVLNKNRVKEWIKTSKSGNEFRLMLVPKTGYIGYPEEHSLGLEYYYTTKKRRDVYSKKTKFLKKFKDYNIALKEAMRYMMEN